MITFVCGELCSGKTVYAKTYAQVDDVGFIEVGDIVRELKQSQDRKVLQDSKKLSEAIITSLKSRIERYKPMDCVVSGVRQKEILEVFPESTLIWIDCPREIRKARYTSRARAGDKISFDEAEKGDIDLGILEIKQYILERK